MCFCYISSTDSYPHSLVCVLRVGNIKVLAYFNLAPLAPGTRECIAKTLGRKLSFSIFPRSNENSALLKLFNRTSCPKYVSDHTSG